MIKKKKKKKKKRADRNYDKDKTNLRNKMKPGPSRNGGKTNLFLMTYSSGLPQDISGYLSVKMNPESRASGHCVFPTEIIKSNYSPYAKKNIRIKLIVCND